MVFDRDYLKKQFDSYVSGYDADDPKIQLKISHSYRVAGLTERIARDIAAAGGVDPDFAWAIGLLHDIGRFEQVRRYGTFIDADSVDHAQLGADLLFKEGLLERLGGEQPEDLRHLMEVAIRNHNAYRIQEGLSERERMYCDILRDADKVDIFRVLWDTPPEKIYNVPLEEIKAAAVSEEVKECFMNRTAVLFSKRKTPVDKIVGHICLTFELVYPISRQIAKEQGYVDLLLSFQSDNAETAHWFEYMRECVWKGVDGKKQMGISGWC